MPGIPEMYSEFEDPPFCSPFRRNCLMMAFSLSRQLRLAGLKPS